MAFGAAVLMLLAFALPAPADDVYLAGGGKLEEVMVEIEGEVVLVHIAGGVMRLPRSEVVRIEEAESPLSRYLRSAEGLADDPAAGARAWLELAWWAERNELLPQAREAAQEAARRDPELPGLEPLMRHLGYAYHHEIGRFIPYEEHMRRRGFVQLDGRWVTPAERQAVLRDEAIRQLERREEAERRLAEQRAERRRAELAAREAAAQVALEGAVQGVAVRGSAAGDTPTVIVVPGYGAPVTLGVSGFFHSFSLGPHRAGPLPSNPTTADPTAAGPQQTGSGPPVLDAYERQAGSLIPGRLDLGGRRR